MSSRITQQCGRVATGVFGVFFALLAVAAIVITLTGQWVPVSNFLNQF